MCITLLGRDMCQICGLEPVWSWTDTHGVAQCFHCGTPHTILHYEGDRPVEKGPEIAVRDECVPFVKRYWDETKSRIPGGYSFPGGQELTTAEERNQFGEWWQKNAEPALVSSSS